MSAAQLTAALATVEQDHRLVLDKMQALKEAVSRLLDPDGDDPRPALERLRDLNKFFVTQFGNHLEEEELTLFPLLERYEGRELVARLRQEHTEIWRRLEDFNNCLDIAAQLEAPPAAVRGDLMMYGWEFLELMDNHAHVETQAVGRCLARSLAEPPRSASRR
jgi:iron-sulfur cluster repair protein YtfE (RIC family)